MNTPDQAYRYLAQFYDHLMEVDYQEWFEYLYELWDRQDGRPLNEIKVLDLACGTGNLTLRFAQHGAAVTGVDISAAMLRQARSKSQQLGLPITWQEQNMVNLRLAEQYDLVICACDGLNYLLEPSEVLSVFSRVYAQTVPGGIFFFDLNSPHKLKETYGNNSFAEMYEDFAYFWDNEFREDAEICEMRLTFFIREEDTLYRRFSEKHRQKVWHAQQITSLLSQVGWKLVGLYGFLGEDPPQPQEERWQFILRRD